MCRKTFSFTIIFRFLLATIAEYLMDKNACGKLRWDIAKIMQIYYFTPKLLVIVPLHLLPLAYLLPTASCGFTALSSCLLRDSQDLHPDRNISSHISFIFDHMCVFLTYLLPTSCLPLAYRLPTSCLPLVYLLSTSCLPLVYFLSTPCIPIVYLVYLNKLK